MTQSRRHLLNNCIIEYGGDYGGNNGYNLYVGDNANASVTLNNVIVRNSQKYGIYKEGAASTITHSGVTFENNTSGNVHWHDGQVYSQIP